MSEAGTQCAAMQPGIVHAESVPLGSVGAGPGHCVTLPTTWMSLTFVWPPTLTPPVALPPEPGGTPPEPGTPPLATAPNPPVAPIAALPPALKLPKPPDARAPPDAGNPEKPADPPDPVGPGVVLLEHAAASETPRAEPTRSDKRGKRMFVMEKSTFRCTAR